MTTSKYCEHDDVSDDQILCWSRATKNSKFCKAHQGPKVTVTPKLIKAAVLAKKTLTPKPAKAKVSVMTKPKTAPAKGTCPQCKRKFKIRKDGKLNYHGGFAWDDCYGLLLAPLEESLAFKVAELKKHPCLNPQGGNCKHDARYDGEFVECYSELQELILALPEN